MTLREAWDKAYSINTTSTFVVTHALTPLLIRSSDPRLLFITSGTSTLTRHDAPLPVNESPDAGWPKKSLFVPGYRSSKTGMNMMMLECARLLKNDGVKVWCVSPGYLATGLGVGQEQNQAAGGIDPAIGAELVQSVIEGRRDGDVGKVVNADGVQPW
jgi:NAD(P)-dependent dehydrogenase (short-subunit alcohol dehydrogenase family)